MGYVELWLVIETICFYVYMFSAVTYIAKHMLVSEVTKPKIQDL